MAKWIPKAAGEQIEVEVFVYDSRNVRTSCGKHQSYIENYQICVEVPKDKAWISRIELVFTGKVKD